MAEPAGVAAMSRGSVSRTNPERNAVYPADIRMYADVSARLVEKPSEKRRKEAILSTRHRVEKRFAAYRRGQLTVTGMRGHILYHLRIVI